ncbi:D-beta-hydroxybutyrate dehydrogenase, mitochondrial-like [Latimeria chalumnae]|uniref:Zgc:113142 n=1 Tax=Latimeria chalumnae TaxID=7897 RepID=H3AT36_LATCH|nr:PREDICTED: D-beta-hydroxybutyrate dehydrogenase, mitochondrial-like [Latimeria chalumnae]|eukprot:XP_006007120.1 PREDICTED: D-beta-hydroxybutyrate dehydrogenase, mitochondrial-like [Latimeria chalumnae]
MSYKILQVSVLLLLGLILSSFNLAYVVICEVPLLFFLLAQKKKKNVDPTERAIFITGCDSGFGHFLAKQLDGMGFTVFAACLFPEGDGAQKLRMECSHKLNVIKLDVTLDEDVAKAKEFVESHLPAKGLWGIVNNSGISTWGEVEWKTIQDYQKIADVNLFGSIRTTIAFISLIRKYRGRMVFMSSLYVHISCSLTSAYTLTKRGLTAFCDSLRIEMKKFGVQVSMIEPGNFSPATRIQPQHTAEEVWSKLSEENKSTYKWEYIKEVTELIKQELQNGNANVNEVIEAIVDALTSATPKAHYRVASALEKVLVFLCIHFPAYVTDTIFSFGLRKLPKL